MYHFTRIVTLGIMALIVASCSLFKYKEISTCLHSDRISYDLEEYHIYTIITFM